MKKNVITVHDNSMINIGYVGDDSSTLVRIPVSSFISRYGDDGVFCLTHVPPGADDGHPVASITVDDGFVEWLIGSEETHYAGIGEAQLRYISNSGAAHTKIWKTRVLRSLTDTGEMPNPWESWVDVLYEIKNDAETAASHYPYIDEETSNWFVWDARRDQFVDTGVFAGGNDDKYYVHHQPTAAAQWYVVHNLGKYPSVSITDSAGSEVLGDVQYIDENNLIISFESAFSGSAYMN